jgi:hypothetical protein
MKTRTLYLSLPLLLAVSASAEVIRDRASFAYGVTTKCTPNLDCAGDVVTIQHNTATSYRVTAINKGWRCSANGVDYKYHSKGTTYGLWGDAQVNRIAVTLIEGKDGTGYWSRLKDVVKKSGKHITTFDEGCLP